MPPPEIVTDLDEFTDGVMDFQRRSGAEYALLHGHYRCPAWSRSISRDLGGVPVVQMFHTLGVVKNAGRSAGRWVPQARVDAEAKVAALADRIVAATPLEAPSSPGTAGPPSSGCGRFRAESTSSSSAGQRGRARERLGLHAEWVLLFVGRPAPIKGLEVLLQALARLKADGLGHADVRLVIVGGDLNEEGNEDRARLRALADVLGVGGWVDFKGPEPQSALPEYYRAADLCLVPSHHESFGMAALEAMACGATVVASRVGGLATTIQDGVTGVLVPPRDDVALAAAIGSLLADGRGGAARPARGPLGAELCLANRGAGARGCL